MTSNGKAAYLPPGVPPGVPPAGVPAGVPPPGQEPPGQAAYPAAPTGQTYGPQAGQQYGGPPAGDPPGGGNGGGYMAGGYSGPAAHPAIPVAQPAQMEMAIMSPKADLPAAYGQPPGQAADSASSPGQAEALYVTLEVFEDNPSHPNTHTLAANVKLMPLSKFELDRNITAREFKQWCHNHDLPIRDLMCKYKAGPVEDTDVLLNFAKIYDRIELPESAEMAGKKGLSKEVLGDHVRLSARLEGAPHISRKWYKEVWRPKHEPRYTPHPPKGMQVLRDHGTRLKDKVTKGGIRTRKDGTRVRHINSTYPRVFAEGGSPMFWICVWIFLLCLAAAIGGIVCAVKSFQYHNVAQHIHENAVVTECEIVQNYRPECQYKCGCVKKSCYKTSDNQESCTCLKYEYCPSHRVQPKAIAEDVCGTTALKADHIEQASDDEPECHNTKMLELYFNKEVGERVMPCWVFKDCKQGWQIEDPAVHEERSEMYWGWATLCCWVCFLPPFIISRWVPAFFRFWWFIGPACGIDEQLGCFRITEPC